MRLGKSRRMPDKKLGRVFLLSVFLHLLVLAALWAYHAPPRETHQTVTVIFREPLKAAPAGINRGAGQGKRRSVPLSALIPKLQMQVRDSNSPVEDTPEPAPTWAEGRAYEGYGEGPPGGLSMAQTQAISFLWRRIDRNIEDNPFLSEHNHTGKVFLRFDLDESGKLIPGTLNASASDRVLKVIAARAVRAAFRDEGSDTRAPLKRTRINARFSWSGYQACESLRGQSGNYLSFCHYAENKRKSFSGGERTATWASAIYNHGPWAYEDIQKYNREERRRESEFNPFKKYELDPDWNL